jgi:hypothetical protein
VTSFLALAARQSVPPLSTAAISASGKHLAAPLALPRTPGSSSRWRAGTRCVQADGGSRGTSSKAGREGHASGSRPSCTSDTGAFEPDSS